MLLPSPRQAREANNALRAVVESDFHDLKEWLDRRLRVQDDMLRSLTASLQHSRQESECGEQVHRRAASKSEPMESPPVRQEPLRAAAFHLPGCPIETLQIPQSSSSAKERVIQIPDSEEDAEPPDDDNPVELTTTSNLQDDADWQSKLMDVFDQLDLDNSGSIDQSEFEEAFNEVGMPSADAVGVFKCMDRTDNGQVDRIEWLHIIEQATRGGAEEVNKLGPFIQKLAERQSRRGSIYETDHTRRHAFILRHDAPIRMTWDICMMCLLFYISLTLPYSLGFGQSEILEHVDRAFDFLFCCDVVLNFRTTYSDRDETIVVDPCKIASKYAKTWFLLDFMSSVPFDMITAGLMPSMTPARLLKIGKIAKVMKLLRISKMLKVFAGSELMEKLEEKSSTKAHQTLSRIAKLICLAFVLCHWMASFGAAVDGGNLDYYFKESGVTSGQRYIAAMYWAMTTLSTVGYGDIIPKSDSERLYAMLAMVVGGAFYGYIVGCVTSIVADMDLNARAFYDRMDLIQSWLDCHDDIPKLLRRRARKHFKVTLMQKSAIDDSAVVNELSPELRADIAFFIIHEQVRRNAMFEGISNSALANLVDVLYKTHTNAEEFIVKQGDPGLSMYILVEGVARYDKGYQWRPSGADLGQRFHKLIQGDSFGEEVVFDMEDTYTYTIVAITACSFHSITEDGFKDKFRNMPELRNQMYASFIKSRRAKEDGRLKESEPTTHHAHGQTGLLKSWTQHEAVHHSGASQNPYRKKK